MVIMAMVSPSSPRAKDAIAAAHRTITMKSRNWSRRISRGEIVFALSSAFFPKWSSRRSASLADSPVMMLVFSREAVSEGLSACHECAQGTNKA